MGTIERRPAGEHAGPVLVTSLHAVLLCRDLEACVRFYRDGLGFPVTDRKTGFVEVQVTPGARIGLLAERRPPAAGAPEQRLLLSFRVEDVQETRRALASRGLDPPAVRVHPWGDRILELRDPQGTRLEFWSPGP